MFLLKCHTQHQSDIVDVVVLPIHQDSVGLGQKVGQVDSHEGEAEHGDAHGGVGQRHLRTEHALSFPRHRRDSAKGQGGAHVGHVADRHKLTGGRQVKAVHSVLHAASDLAVAAAEVRHHQRGRSGRQDGGFKSPTHDGDHLACDS